MSKPTAVGDANQSTQAAMGRKAIAFIALSGDNLT
jgi:hypothetical protein